MDPLDRLCEAIMVFEGWKPGSKSYRNCNPGNLRGSIISHYMDDSGMCVFKTFSEGWNALIWDISCKCTGKTRTGLGPESTLVEFFKVYAPSEDNNDPESYCQFVCKRAGFTPETKLKEIWTGK